MPPHHHHPHPHDDGPAHHRHRHAAIVMPPLDDILDLGDYDDEQVAEAFYDVLDQPIPEEWKAKEFFDLGRQRRLLREIDELRTEIASLRAERDAGPKNSGSD